MKIKLPFGLVVFFIWLIATAIDRYCWTNLSGIPAWDQADYLNSALDHGREINLLEGGNWEGFKSLLDLSPKIPPLASLVNGSIIAIAGYEPKYASWNLSIWNGLLIFIIAKWGIELRNQYLALLSVSFVAIAPVLVQLRTDYVLELPLTTSISGAIWLTGLWLHPTKGGKWMQALWSSIFLACSILIKQSSLLVIIPVLIYSVLIIFKRKKILRYQIITSFLFIIATIIPWLKHNWITFIGGTNRAVFESAAKEGDPNLLTIENWLWYPKLLPEQIGFAIFLIGISGIIIWLRNKNRKNNYLEKDNIFAWQWLAIILFSSWILTSLSPNKDERYIAPLIPLIILLLCRGWLEWMIWIKHRNIFKNKIHLSSIVVFTGIISTIIQASFSQVKFLKNSSKGPIREIINTVKINEAKDLKKTIVVVPSTPDLNQHNISYFGRTNGWQIVGRQLGNSKNDIPAVINQAEWIILATGDQGSIRENALFLDKAIRKSNVFIEIKRFPRINGDNYSLWHRDLKRFPPIKFARFFPKLAQNLAIGPQGLEVIFNEVNVQHMLDGHFEYRALVQKEATEKLKRNPNNADSYWTLTLLSILANRPEEASVQLRSLQELLPNNPWPSAYLVVVEMARWNPWGANLIAQRALSLHSNNLILEGLADLSAILGGKFWRIPNAYMSIPKAMEEINESNNK